MKLKLITNLFVYAVISFLLMAVGYLGYLWCTYIDETVTTGHAYGFSIGDGKLETYKKFPEVLGKLNSHASSIYIEIKVDAEHAELLATKPGYTMMVETLLHDVGYPAFQSKSRWDFYFDGSYFNSLTLKFCGETLCEIYRHRKYFEFP